MEVALGLLIAAVVAPFVLLLSALSTMWFSWWIYPAWAWFVVPLGLPQITLWHFIGLSVLLHTRGVSWETPQQRKKETVEYVTLLILSVLGPIIVWAFLSWLHGHA